jgi:hypothetical protein
MSIIKNNRIINSTGLRGLLSLLFLAASLTACAAFKGKQKKKKKMEVQYTLTVARILPGNDTDSFTEVTFSESQRFYRLPKTANHSYLEILTAAEKSGKPVIVRRANETSDIILSVKKAGH